LATGHRSGKHQLAFAARIADAALDEVAGQTPEKRTGAKNPLSDSNAWKRGLAAERKRDRARD
jgi:hypothetical protein